jgi:hypothetical protein
MSISGIDINTTESIPAFIGGRESGYPRSNSKFDPSSLAYPAALVVTASASTVATREPDMGPGVGCDRERIMKESVLYLELKQRLDQARDSTRYAEGRDDKEALAEMIRELERLVELAAVPDEVRPLLRRER